jgi:GH18 family chitinase
MFAYVVLLLLTNRSVSTRVVGYLPEWQEIDYREVFQSGLTHLILFSVEINAGNIMGLSRLPNEAKLAMIHREAAEAGVKVMLCVGGAGRSAGFAEVARTQKKRSIFLNALNAVLAGNKLAGVEFNWERPVTEGDWRDFSKLIKDAKKVLLDGKAIVAFSFHPDGITEGMIAASPDLLQHADFALSMAYDDPHLHSSVSVCQQAIDNWKGHRLNTAKLVVGTAFYARHKSSLEAKAYRDVYTNKAGVWLRPSQQELREKLKRLQGYGGIMIWALGHDLHPTHSMSLMSVFLESKWSDAEL